MYMWMVYIYIVHVVDILGSTADIVNPSLVYLQQEQIDEHHLSGSLTISVKFVLYDCFVLINREAN